MIAYNYSTALLVKFSKSKPDHSLVASRIVGERCSKILNSEFLLGVSVGMFRSVLETMDLRLGDSSTLGLLNVTLPLCGFWFLVVLEICLALLELNIED